MLLLCSCPARHLLAAGARFCGGLLVHVPRHCEACGCVAASTLFPSHQPPQTNQPTLGAGRPGVGKTTAIREISRLLADECQRRVVIVDTSNEIGGDGDIPHPGIGRARRMQVGRVPAHGCGVAHPGAACPEGSVPTACVAGLPQIWGGQGR